MEISRINLLVANATIIIGLLILLTFQSISSSFIESESSEFITKWYDTQNQLATIDSILVDCKKYDGDIPNLLNQNFATPSGTRLNLSGDTLTNEMKVEIQNYCNKLIVEKLKQSKHLLTLDEWGFNFHYLQQVDESGKILTAENNDSFNPNLSVKESDYLHNIISGPLWVNLTNLFMIFPFLISAIIASFNSIRKNNETNNASKAAIVSMGIGFVTMIAGLIIITIGFITVYSPFLE